MPESIVVANDFIYRVNVVIRNEPLTGTFSYTLWDRVNRAKAGSQTQFTTFEEAVAAAAQKVRELMIGSAANAESALVEELLALREVVAGNR